VSDNCYDVVGCSSFSNLLSWSYFTSTFVLFKDVLLLVTEDLQKSIDLAAAFKREMSGASFSGNMSVFIWELLSTCCSIIIIIVIIIYLFIKQLHKVMCKVTLFVETFIIV